MRRLLVPLAAMAIIYAMSSGVIFAGEFTQTVGSWLPMENGVERFRTFWSQWWWLFTKGFHVLEFGALTWLLFSGFQKALKLPFEQSLRLAALVALLFAGLDEYHQHFVPGRGGRLTDVIIDALGITLASFFIQRYQNRTVNPSPQTVSQTSA